jgi:hypothetical protein
LATGSDVEQVELAKSAAEIARDNALSEGLTEEEATVDAEDAFASVVSGESSVDDLIETAALEQEQDEATFNFGDTTPTLDFDDVPVFDAGEDTGDDPFVESAPENDTPPEPEPERIEVVEVVEVAVAEAAIVEAGAVTGREDTAIALDISAKVTDASDTIGDITISGVPAGATLSAGTDNGDGTWTLSVDDLAGLTITPAENDASDFELSVLVTTKDGDSVANSGATFAVTVSGVADAPEVTVADVSGGEDTARAISRPP